MFSILFIFSIASFNADLDSSIAIIFFANSDKVIANVPTPAYASIIKFVFVFSFDITSDISFSACVVFT